ncbi:MAG: hypothetical protein ACPHK8_05920 [Thermoplasmatota archaeon]
MHKMRFVLLPAVILASLSGCVDPDAFHVTTVTVPLQSASTVEYGAYKLNDRSTVFWNTDTVYVDGDMPTAELGRVDCSNGESGIVFKLHRGGDIVAETRVPLPCGSSVAYEIHYNPATKTFGKVKA